MRFLFAGVFLSEIKTLLLIEALEFLSKMWIVSLFMVFLL